MFAKTKIQSPLISTLSICLLLSGCASRGGILGVDCCADIADGAIPEPAGAKVCQWQTAHVESAITDQTVLYQADFVGRTEELSPSAIDRLARNTASRLIDVRPYVIEPSGDDLLDNARLNSVVNLLATVGASSPDVEIAIPAALGLRGHPFAESVARSVGGNRRSSGGIGAPTSRSFGQSGQTGSLGRNLPGGVF